ncbi:MAG: GDSL-type esterase/lipase family protein [Sulfuricaulis sp.]|uniref:GDSL-type esterase/lipase family protein n=1 Tax=Sulfuricaulis sp. TaxID=2003553 RepID=UPI0034A58378
MPVHQLHYFNMRDLLNLPSITARHFISLVLLLIGASGCDGGGGTSAPLFNVPPVASNSCNAIMDPDPSIVVPLSANDSNGNATIASYTIDTLPTNGSLSGCVSVPCLQSCATIAQCASFTYTPNASATGLRGMDKFNFHVTDAGGLSSSMATAWILNNGKVRIMPLGDSITEGTGDPNGVGYRRRLFQQLEALVGTGRVDFVGSLASGNPPDFDLNHEGHGGWCDDSPCSGGFGNIKDSVQGFLSGNPTDIVLLHIGTNDFNVSSAGVDGILTNISTWAQSNFPVTVFVARIIPAVDGTKTVNTFNDNVAAIATDRPAVKVYNVNQQDVLQLQGQLDKADPTLMGDNLHPNQTGYNMMADKWKLDMQGATVPVLPTCQ